MFDYQPNDRMHCRERAIFQHLRPGVRSAAGAAILLAIVAGCATTPRDNQQLERAHAEVEKLGLDPLAQQFAGPDLNAARASLQKAQIAFQNRENVEVVDHQAYLALRHAEAGEARVSAARARQDMANAQDEQRQILAAQQARRAQREARQAEQERASARAAAAKLQQVQQQLAALQAKPTDRGMVLTLSDILFDTGKATLHAGAQSQLSRLADLLKSNANQKIRIEGYTDSRGSEAYNDDLSARRARAVANELISVGAAPGQITTYGFGEQYPVATNDTAAGRLENRRVEIVFSDASGHFTAASDRENAGSR